MNRVVLVGRLTKDPELKYTGSNLPVATFTIAVSRPFSNQQTGERDADFIQCVVWRKQAENLAKYITKGGLIGVEGRIQSRSYDDPQGQKRYITEVVCDQITFLESKNGIGEERLDEPKSGNDMGYNNIDFSNDDLPF